jgi:hypothetical protein
MSSQPTYLLTFIGELTDYTTRHTNISSYPTFPYSQVNLHTTPDTLRLVVDSRIYINRLTYILHHQTR